MILMLIMIWGGGLINQRAKILHISLNENDTNTESNHSIAPDTQPTYTLDKVSTSASLSQREIFAQNDNIASISGEALQKLNLQNSKDLQQVFSGLYMSYNASNMYPVITLRGIHAGYYYNQSVKIYVDGVPQDVSFLSQEILDVESVELFKGMGATIFGENLSIHSNIATNTPKINGSVSFGNLDKNIIASASGAIVPNKLYAKVSFKHADFLGQIKDSSTGKMADTSTSNLARISFLYDDSKYFAGLDYYYDNSLFHDWFYLSDSQKQNLSVDFSTTLGGIPNINRTVQTYAFKSGLRTENLEVSNVFSVQDRTIPFSVSGMNSDENNRTFTDELKATQTYSNNSTSLYGLYFSHSDFNRIIFQTTTYPSNSNNVKNFTFGAFTDHKIILPANFDLSLGLRYSYYTNSIRYNQGNSTIPSFNDSTDSHQISGRVALSWTLFDNHKFYLSGSRGFQAGGFPFYIGGIEYKNSYKPESTYTTEIGYKGFFWNDRIYINTDYFFIYTQNRQQSVCLVGGCNLTTGSWIGNIGDILSHGFEFEGKCNFLRDSFFMLNFAYINAKYLNVANNSVIAQNITEGSRVWFVPEYTLRSSIDTIIWRNSFANIYFNAALSFNSKIYFDAIFTQDPYTLLNLGLRAERKNLSLGVQIANVLNELYNVYGSNFAGKNYNQIGRLRNFTFTLSAKF